MPRKLGPNGGAKASWIGRSVRVGSAWVEAASAYLHCVRSAAAFLLAGELSPWHILQCATYSAAPSATSLSCAFVTPLIPSAAIAATHSRLDSIAPPSFSNSTWIIWQSYAARAVEP